LVGEIGILGKSHHIMLQKEMLGNRMSQQERFPTNLILDKIFVEQKM
jgi:hypothetical protein